MKNIKSIVAIILLLCFCISGCSAYESDSTASNYSDTTKKSLETTFSTESIQDTSGSSQDSTESAISSSHVHDFGAATCTNPKTCSGCGETTGSANGHNWKGATCLEPQTCISCNATEGSAAEHSWKNATCSEPKTCTLCGTTSGLTAGHTFSNGRCTSCRTSDPNYTISSMVWIPTKGGTKYHTHSGCSNMDGPEQVTQSEAESRGFTPCKRCH